MKNRTWTIPAVLLCLALIAALSLGGRLPAVSSNDDKALEVFYIANEGFLITGNGQKVLIDALFRDGIRPYLKASPANSEKLEKAASPFDRVDLLLTTHFHADHYDPLSVAAHLSNNPRSMFISTPQAVDKLKAIGNYEAVKDRVKAILPKEGERVRLSHNGLQVQMLNITHGRNRPIENLGFILEIAGKKILHIGDSEATGEDFAKNNLSKEAIDIAFLPFWYLLGADEKRAIREQINPKRIVVMHIPSLSEKDDWIEKRGGWAKVLGNIRTEFPNAVMFEKQMEGRNFN